MEVAFLYCNWHRAQQVKITKTKKKMLTQHIMLNNINKKIQDKPLKYYGNQFVPNLFTLRWSRTTIGQLSLSRSYEDGSLFESTTKTTSYQGHILSIILPLNFFLITDARLA